LRIQKGKSFFLNPMKFKKVWMLIMFVFFFHMKKNHD